MPKSNEGTGRFTVTLPKSVIEQLEEIANERGTRRAIVMREAVLTWLKNQAIRQQRRAS